MLLSNMLGQGPQKDSISQRYQDRSLSNQPHHRSHLYVMPSNRYQESLEYVIPMSTPKRSLSTINKVNGYYMISSLLFKMLKAPKKPQLCSKQLVLTNIHSHSQSYRSSFRKSSERMKPRCGSENHQGLLKIFQFQISSGHTWDHGGVCAGMNNLGHHEIWINLILA